MGETSLTGQTMWEAILDSDEPVHAVARFLMSAKAIGHDGVDPRGDATQESRRATPRNYGLRLVIASDTHEQHVGLVVPDGDVFIHCGDLTYRGDLQAIAKAGTWIRSLPHRHKIVIAGNHDWAFELKSDAARRCLGAGEDGLIDLQDSGVVIAGVSFWGSPWQPWFFDWAFNLQRGAALSAKWALIPDFTEVLITHGPPMGILDCVPRGEHVGCADLLARIAAVKPKVHAFGHIHEGSGVLVKEETTYVNASICDGEYRPVNPVRVVDL